MLRFTGPAALLTVLGALMCSSLQGAFVVQGEVTPLGGGTFHYDFTVINDTLDDFLVLSLTDAPPADPLIAPSLATPVGFIPSYDGGLGIVDFLSDTELFAAGTTHAGFGFDSGSPPGPGVFSVFEALTINFEPITGSIQYSAAPAPVPEPGTLGLVALGLAVMASRARKPGAR